MASVRPTTAFIDRDGVINRRLPGDYVKSWAEFEFLPGAIEGLATIRAAGAFMVVVTNQRGVSRGLMSMDDVVEVHRAMRAELRRHHADVDAIYVCPDMDGPMRKPAPGMLFSAAREHDRVDLGSAVMLGDSPTDIRAAHAAGVPGVLIADEAGRVAKLVECEAHGAPAAGVFESLREASSLLFGVAEGAR